MTIQVIGDASPLIYFSKMDALNYLAATFGSVGVAPAVHHEAVVVGLERGFPDAIRIERAFNNGWLVLVSLTETERNMAVQIQKEHRLGSGESETIACCVRRSTTALLHDRKARRVAVEYGVSTWKPGDILLLALIRHQISWVTFRKLLQKYGSVSGLPTVTLLELEALANEIAIQFDLKENENE